MPSRNRSSDVKRPSAFSCRSCRSCRSEYRWRRHLSRYLKPKAKEFEEWDEILCPVCMEPPHRAVLLLCSSYEKGCRPFMCNTGDRYSNCLTQYCKGSNGLVNNKRRPKFKLSCPLCRGAIFQWKVIDTARNYMNEKLHSCSVESCDFTGSYFELRRHSRAEHLPLRILKDDS